MSLPIFCPFAFFHFFFPVFFSVFLPLFSRFFPFFPFPSVFLFSFSSVLFTIRKKPGDTVRETPFAKPRLNLRRHSHYAYHHVQHAASSACTQHIMAAQRGLGRLGHVLREGQVPFAVLVADVWLFFHGGSCINPEDPLLRAREKPNKHKHFGRDGVRDKQEPPLAQMGPFPGTNWDLSLGQTGLSLLISTLKSPFCPVGRVGVRPWDLGRLSHKGRQKNVYLLSVYCFFHPQFPP